eukprot:8848960-Pyramimonas_sp.AAC.1
MFTFIYGLVTCVSTSMSPPCTGRPSTLSAPSPVIPSTAPARAAAATSALPACGPPLSRSVHNILDPPVPPPIGPCLGYILPSLLRWVPVSGRSSRPSSDWSPPR